MRHNRSQRVMPGRADRRGSATVEFALVIPLLVALTMGAIEAGYNFDTTHKLYAAIRQSGRLASMDNSKKLLPGQSANDKVMLDIKNALSAEGLPGSQATVTITHANGEQAGTTFNLSDPNNDLKYFRISVTLPYAAVNPDNFLPGTLTQLRGSVVFRKGRVALVN